MVCRLVAVRNHHRILLSLLFLAASLVPQLAPPWMTCYESSEDLFSLQGSGSLSRLQILFTLVVLE